MRCGIVRSAGFRWCDGLVARLTAVGIGPDQSQGLVGGAPISSKHGNATPAHLSAMATRHLARGRALLYGCAALALGLVGSTGMAPAPGPFDYETVEIAPNVYGFF